MCVGSFHLYSWVTTVSKLVLKYVEFVKNKIITLYQSATFFGFMLCIVLLELRFVTAQYKQMYKSI